MHITIDACVDRMTFNSGCLKTGITLESFLAELQKVTLNVRTNSATRTIEVFFNENDYDNYPEGYEDKVMEVIKKYTDSIILSSSRLNLEADFAPPLV